MTNTIPRSRNVRRSKRLSLRGFASQSETREGSSLQEIKHRKRSSSLSSLSSRSQKRKTRSSSVDAQKRGTRSSYVDAQKNNVSIRIETPEKSNVSITIETPEKNNISIRMKTPEKKILRTPIRGLSQSERKKAFSSSKNDQKRRVSFSATFQRAVLLPDDSDLDVSFQEISPGKLDNNSFADTSILDASIIETSNSFDPISIVNTSNVDTSLIDTSLDPISIIDTPNVETSLIETSTLNSSLVDTSAISTFSESFILNTSVDNSVNTSVIPSVKKSKVKQNTNKKVVPRKRSITASIPSNVKIVYKLVSRLTGGIGGNGCGGAIYGELSIGSMHKVVHQMKKHMHFSSSSRFIDIGCGLGKPNLHVCQDPGVQFSYGIEMERVRWTLSMTNLHHVFRKEEEGEILTNRCYLEYGNINQASTLDPFTHVYMFDVGFPPVQHQKIAIMFNKSQSPYLISYYNPRRIIEQCNFNVELLSKFSTSMHGSNEQHTCYLYARVSDKVLGVNLEELDSKNILCDPLFSNAWLLTQGGSKALHYDVQQKLDQLLQKGLGKNRYRTRRSTMLASKVQ